MKRGGLEIVQTMIDEVLEFTAAVVRQQDGALETTNARPLNQTASGRW